MAKRRPNLCFYFEVHAPLYSGVSVCVSMGNLTPWRRGADLRECLLGVGVGAA